MSCPFMGTKGPAPGAKSSMRYGDYLKLDAILDCQNPLSDVPDELLFIIQHQTTELWMKLLLHELTRASSMMRAGRIEHSLKALYRAQRTMDHMIHAWSVLATLTPVEFLAMRPSLGSASGHQSVQFREIEFLLGNKNIACLAEHAGDQRSLHSLQSRLFAPSLYDEVVTILASHGLDVSPERLQADPCLATQYDPSVEHAWLTVYRTPDAHWQLFELGERLVDLEDSFKNWRSRHVSTVERVIGHRPGTGGTDGVNYLRKTQETVLFPELWRLRTAL
ncbi:tryptophan 2,3-dioxygenase family protein [Pseudomonas chlororaphis]